MATKELGANDAFKQLESLFGDDAIFHPKTVEKIETISTRSPSLDFAIGRGGVPRGRVIQFAGKESSGKTFLALQVAAEWQAQHPDNCFAFLDAEFTYDPAWAAGFGVDNNRVFLVKSNEAEKLFQGLVGRVKVNKVTKKEVKVKGLFDMIADGSIIDYPHPDGNKMNKLNLGRCGVIIVDSIAAMQAPVERQSEVGKQNMALMARFLSVELRKVTPGAAKANAAVIFINQLRVDPGQMFGNPETSPGGRAIKHACSLMVNFAPLSGAENILTNDYGARVGHKVRAKILKNKVAPPYAQCDYFIKYTEGIVKKEDEVFDIGESINFWEKPSPRTYVVGGEKCSSKAAALDMIKSDIKRFEKELREFYISSEIYASSSASEEPEEEIPADPFNSESDEEYDIEEE